MAEDILSSVLNPIRNFFVYIWQVVVTFFLGLPPWVFSVAKAIVVVLCIFLSVWVWNHRESWRHKYYTDK